MIDLISVNDRICYFKVPYKDIFVAIYILRTEKGVVLFDTAACDQDVDSWIVPALEQLGVTPTHIFVSHNHKDHAGGLARAAALFPDARIVARSATLAKEYPNVLSPEDGDVLLDTLQVVAIPGHTIDCSGLLDLATNTLVCGDCMQSYGIFGSGYWYGNITFPAEHFAAIEKVRKLNIETVATAHDYHPCDVVSVGKEVIKLRLDSCVDALKRVLQIAEENSALDDTQVAELCNDSTFPKVAPKVITALRAARAEGRI